MAKIPSVLWDAINTAFPDHVMLLGTPMPDGYVQISPRGSVVVYDEETLGFWARGHGTTHDNMKDGDKVTLFIRHREIRQFLPKGGIARFYGTVTVYKDGPVREAIWEKMIEAERERDPDKKGYAVLVAIERAETLDHAPLEEFIQSEN